MKATKDNIDLGNVVTTAGCPAFGYVPDQSAYVARRLTDAGAIPIGKTNLDQFATGLVGTRSPYGIPQNRYNHRFIPGGSSAGSASAVAHDLVGFALGTDSAGSGRIPAAFNNLVGWKPTRGQEVPSPLGPGKIKLKTGEQVTGFLMESSAAASAEDISSLGSWKNVAQ